MLQVHKVKAGGYAPRKAFVHVPDLKEWFDDDECQWPVKSLTAEELALVEEQVAINRQAQTTIAAAGLDNEKADAVRALLDALKSGTAPDLHVRRLNYVVLGTDITGFDISAAVALSIVHPVEFVMIFNKIQELTGQGQVKKKPSASSPSPASEPPSP